MAPSSDTIQHGFRRFLGEMTDFFSRYPFLRETEFGLRSIGENTLRPFSVAVFGRMKTGKSTLINALVGRPLAITGVEEATATINWISYGDAMQADSFIVHWKDGRNELLPIARMTDWAGKDEAVIARVRATSHIELFANAEALKRVQIIDTPGTGSVAEAHEEAAHSFLNSDAAEDSVAEGRKADALIYVFPPVARERDEEALAIYRSSCLPGSDPYNSVGVLHKWDALETDGDILEEVERKAERLRQALKGVVADVIPVSGPIALLSRSAPDNFFFTLCSLLDSSDIAASLRTDARWDRDATRCAVRMASGLPWASFRRVAQLGLHHRPKNSLEFRELCLGFSQFTRLERFLDARFFGQAAIIKQRQGRVRAKALIEPAFDLLSRRIESLRKDATFWEQLKASVSQSSFGMSDWVRKKAVECGGELNDLETASVKADRFWRDEKERMEALDGDLQISRRMDSDPSFVDAADAAMIRQLCQALSVQSQTAAADIAQIAPLHELTRLRRRYAAGTQAADAERRTLYTHLTRRIVAAMAALIPKPPQPQ